MNLLTTLRGTIITIPDFPGSELLPPRMGKPPCLSFLRDNSSSQGWTSSSRGYGEGFQSWTVLSSTHPHDPFKGIRSCEHEFMLLGPLKSLRPLPPIGSASRHFHFTVCWFPNNCTQNLWLKEHKFIIWQFSGKSDIGLTGLKSSFLQDCVTFVGSRGKSTCWTSPSARGCPCDSRFPSSIC